MIRGKIGPGGLREILSSLLLGKVPYLLETPHNPAAMSRYRNSNIRLLEEERFRKEHTTLRDMFDMTDERWEDVEHREEWLMARQR